MGGTPRQRPQRGSSQGSIQSVGAMSGNSTMLVGPAPTTKPPTPPQVTRTGSKVSVSGGTLSKGNYFALNYSSIYSMIDMYKFSIFIMCILKICRFARISHSSSSCSASSAKPLCS